MSWKMSTSAGGSSPLVSRACRWGVGGATVWLFTTLSRYLTTHSLLLPGGTVWVPGGFWSGIWSGGPCMSPGFGSVVGSGFGSALGSGTSLGPSLGPSLGSAQDPNLCLGSSVGPGLGLESSLGPGLRLD